MQPSAEYNLRRPNELGRIPIIMYHSVDDSRSFDSRGLNVSQATFRRHLKLLLQYGMYPINLRDLRSHSTLAQVPKGLIPVVLTFDDGRRSQFVMSPAGIPTNQCAVGIFEQFIRDSAAGWKRRASFYVMPKSTYNLEPFQQVGKAAAKLQYLVDAGYEVGNHTWSHRSLRRLSESQVVAELMRCFYGIRSLCPNTTMDTLCIPFGEYPKIPNWRKVLTNPLRQVTDMHSTVLMAWGGPSYSPFDKRYDHVRVTRIGVSPNELENTLMRLARTETWYVSGGEAGVLHVPAKLLKFVSNNVQQGLTVRTQ